MLKRYYYDALRNAFRIAAWFRFNRTNAATVTPDQIILVNPRSIREKTLDKPSISRFLFTAVVDGDWDCAVESIEEDIVYKSFVSHFLDGRDWQDTPYVEFLKGSVSEHGRRSEPEILHRCSQLDQLYAYIHENGFKSQQALEAESDVVMESWKHRLIPPEFREIAVNIARDGRLLWHGGFHRLCIAILQSIDEIPVRVAIRHSRWQQIRNEIASSRRDPSDLATHPDIQSIVPTPKPTTRGGLG